MLADVESRYQRFIKDNNLKSSKRRDLIFEYVSKTNNHFTVDDIYSAMLKIDPEIGIATVYRTVRMLVDCGILIEHTFGEKKGFFEVVDLNSRHHDHLICNVCGKIVEFECDTIENDQQKIAARHQFKIESHKLEIYGLCKACQKLDKTRI